MSLILAVLPAGLTSSFLEGRAGESAPVLCKRCQCCLERNANTVPQKPLPSPAARAAAPEQIILEKSTRLIAVLFPLSEALASALIVPPFSSTELPFFERYCSLLI